MEEDRLLLLRLVKNNGKIENLTRQGYEYSQVAKMMSEMLISNYIVLNSSRIELTIDGENELNRLNQLLNNKKINKFVSHQREYLLNEKKDVFDIYLPEKI